MLNKLKNIFLEQPPEYLTNCINCGKKLKGKQMKFCKNKCNYQYWNKVRHGKLHSNIRVNSSKEQKLLKGGKNKYE